MVEPGEYVVTLDAGGKTLTKKAGSVTARAGPSVAVPVVIH